MSFASEVKKELLSIEDVSSCCRKSTLLGILQGASDIVFTNGGMKIIIKSYLLSVIQKTMNILKSEYSIEPIIKYGDDKNVNKLRYYYLEINSNAEQIIRDYHLMPFDEITLDNFKNECCKNAFIRGLFIARGSINDPRKNCYHFEITVKKEEIAFIVKYIFNQNDIDAKIRERSNNYTIYIKRSEEISSALALIGAASGVFYFEDSRIVRDISNMANRMANCDIANVKKSTEAAQKQLKAIEYIRKVGHFNKMPIRLQTIALMREEYPDATLEDLSDYSDKMFGKTLSKSGVSHCLRSLMQFYEDLYSKNSVKKTKD